MEYSVSHPVNVQKDPNYIYILNKSGTRSRSNSDKLGNNLLGNGNKTVNLCIVPLFWKLAHSYNVVIFPFSSLLPFNV